MLFFGLKKVTIYLERMIGHKLPSWCGTSHESEILWLES